VDYEEWHQNSLCALKKAGKGKDYSDPNNWRGICLAEIPAIIQSSIISNRLLLHLEKVGIETQYGCVPGKGCTDALYAIKTALQIRKQHGKDTWAVFVDLIKVFDTADHSLLFAILKKYGIPDSIITVIEKMYKDSIVSIIQDWNGIKGYNIWYWSETGRQYGPCIIYLPNECLCRNPSGQMEV
jgi:hypothetical protein